MPGMAGMAPVINNNKNNNKNNNTSIDSALAYGQEGGYKINNIDNLPPAPPGPAFGMYNTNMGSSASDNGIDNENDDDNIGEMQQLHDIMNNAAAITTPGQADQSGQNNGLGVKDAATVDDVIMDDIIHDMETNAGNDNLNGEYAQ